MRRITPARDRLPSRRARLHLEDLENRIVPATFSWKVDASSNWNNPANWTLVSGALGVGYPDASNDVALLISTITNNRTITIPDNVTISVSDIQIDDNNSYTIAPAGPTGTGRLSFSGSSLSLQVTNLLGNGAHTISAPATLLGTLAVTNNSSGVLTMSGALSERTFPLPIIRGGITKDGTGTLRLSGGDDNTFTLNTTVQNGTLELNKTAGNAAFGGNLVVGDGSGAGATAVARHLQGDNIPTAATVTVNADGFYNLNNQSDSFGPLVVTDGIVFVGTGLVSFTALTMTGGTITATGAGEVNFAGNATINASATGSTMDGTGHIQLGGGLGVSRTFTVADSPTAPIDLDISLEVQGAALFSAGLTKAGPGTMRLDDPGTFAGAAILSAGTLLVGNNAALGTGTVVVNGGTLQADGAARTLANAVTLGGDFTVAGTFDLTFSGQTTLTGNRTITVTNTGLTTFGGIVAQDAAGRSLTKAGSGTLRLSGGAANTYTGLTTVADGALELNKTAAIAAFAGDLTVGDGTGAASSAVARHVQSNNILPTATVTVNADGLYDLNGLNEDFGPLVVNGGSTTVGAGVLTFTALTMTGGSITATGNGEVNFGGNATINASTGGSTISGGHVQLGIITRTFTVADGAAAIDLNINSEIRQGASPAGVTKVGPGTLRFAGTTSNTYTGLTTVSAGTLEMNKTGGAGILVAVAGDLTVNGGIAREAINNQVADTAAVNVNTGGTFDLNGFSDTVGTVTVTGGTVTTTGTGVGRLTAGNTSFNAASTLAMKLVGAANSDRVTVNGTVAVGGALQLSLATAVASGTTILLIDNDGADAVAGTFTGLLQGAGLVVGGQSFLISYTGGTGNDVVLLRADPPRVTNTQANPGAAQRSMVTSIAVTFDQAVSFLSGVAPAFTLARISDGAAVNFTGSAAIVAGVTVVTLTNFTGTASSFGSLADGRYTLRALSSQVKDATGALSLDGNGDGIGGGAPADDFVFADSGALTGNQLFRLFGDSNGDRLVNAADTNLFRTFLGAPASDFTFDSNRDGVINAADLNAYRTNLGAGI